MAQADSRIFEFGPFRLQARKRLLLKDGEPLALSPKACEILLLLVENRGRVIEKEELMRKVWADSFVEEANLTVQMSALRKALGETKNEHPYIATVSGRGYRFLADVREVEEGRSAVEQTAEKRVDERTGRIADKAVAECKRTSPAQVFDSLTESAVGESSDLIVEEHTLSRLTFAEGAKALPGRPFRRPLITTLTFAVALALAFLFYHLLTGRTPKPAARSIAVLPFNSLSADANDDYLGLGLADTLITKLSSTGRFIVRPTTAVRKFTEAAQDPVAAGNDLGVDAVLDGSIQRLGDRVRITARLTDVKSKLPLWAEKFDEEFKDLFAVQDRVSEQTAQALTVKLTGDEQRRLAKSYTDNMEAYQAYLKGRFFWGKRTPEGYQKAIDNFEQALRLDPRYALAYAGLADCHFFRGEQMPPAETMPKAREAAVKALEIDDTLAEAYASLAKVKQYYDWDWAGAEQAFQRAIERDPNYATAHHWYAQLLMDTGRTDGALREINRARELEPLSLIINTDVGGILQDARRYDEAIAVYRRALELDANFARAHLDLGRALGQKGLYEEAADEIQKAMELSEPTPRMIAALGYVQAASGNRAKAIETIERLRRMAKQSYVSGYNLALIYAGLGDKEQALNLLEQAYQERFGGLAYLQIEPRFDSLRAEGRFNDLLRRLGFFTK